jgi:hypothetical protein
VQHADFESGDLRRTLAESDDRPAILFGDEQFRLGRCLDVVPLVTIGIV